MTATPSAGLLARTPEPPYWAVIFTSQRTPLNDERYARASKRMAELAGQQPGFLGVESARGADGMGITVSYWASEEAFRLWKQVAEHQAVQRTGRERWYEDYEVRVCRVERAYTLKTSTAVGLDEPPRPRR